MNTTPTAILVFGATTCVFTVAPGGNGGRLPSDIHFRRIVFDGIVLRCKLERYAAESGRLVQA